MSKQLHKVKEITLISFLMLVFFSQKTNAQYYGNNEYQLFVGGLIAGPDWSQVDGDGYKGYDKIGFMGGAILYLPLGDIDLPFDGTIAFSMEVLYTQKGARGKGGIPNANVSGQQINLHYAEIPFQINLYRGARKSNFGMGFSIGYLGFSEETITQGSGVTLKNALPFRKFDLNYVLTGNIHLWSGFFLSPRFQYSLISVRNNNGRYGGRDEQFNNVIALRVMYLFNDRRYARGR